MSPGCRAVPLAALLAAACTAPVASSCPAGYREHTAITGFFGRNGMQGGREVLRVTEPEWSRYLATGLLPLVPGSTVTDAAGTWRGRHGPEPTKAVTVVAPPGREGETLRAFEQAAAAYRHSFDQEAVAILLTRTCGAGFEDGSPRDDAVGAR